MTIHKRNPEVCRDKKPLWRFDDIVALLDLFDVLGHRCIGANLIARHHAQQVGF